MSGDLVIGIRLKADGSDLVGEVKVSRKEMDRFGDSVEKTSRKTRQLNKQTQRTGKRLNDMKRHVTLLRVAVLALATGISARLVRSFIDAASVSERYATTLKVVLGDVAQANGLFEDMADLAARVPFEFREIMGAASQLAGVVRNGREEIVQLMPIILDIAAATGLSVQETTGGIIRMYSAGAAAADLFRERGILAALGFQAGVSVSAEETMRRVVASWEDGTSRYKGATAELAKNWDGIMSMMSDKWFAYRNLLMDAGPFDSLKSSFNLLNASIGGNMDEMRSSAEGLGRDIVDLAEDIALGTAGVVDAATPAIEGIAGAIDIFWQGFKDLPDWAQEGGVVGALLFGKKGLAILLAVSALNEAANRINAASQKGMEDFGVPKGIRDFMNDPTGSLFGGGEGGGDTDLSLKDRVQEIINQIREGAADIRAEREAAASAGGGSSARGGSGGSADRVSALKEEKDAVGELILALQDEVNMLRFEGETRDLQRTIVEAQNRAMKEGRLLTGEEINQIVELTARRNALTDAEEAAEKAAKDNTKAISDIERAYARLPKTYKQNIAAADKWRTDALANLDQAAAGYNDFAAMVDEIHRDLMVQAYDDSLEASDKWSDGIIRALRDIQSEAEDMAAMWEDAVYNMASSAEDAFVDIAMTGELNFRKLADSILEELIRIQVRSKIIKPLAGFFEGLLDFSGAGGTDASLDAQFRDVRLAHDGGLAGSGGASRSVPLSTFADAQRLHRGGLPLLPGEVPAILKQDEEVLTTSDPRHRFNGGLGPAGGGTVINLIDQRGADAPDISINRGQGPNNEDLIEIIVPLMEQAIDRGDLDDPIAKASGGSRRLEPGS